MTSHSHRRLLLAVEALVVALLLTLGLVWATHSSGNPSQQTSAAASPFGQDSLAGAPAPSFSLKDQTGAVVTMDSLRGRPVALTFLDTYCPHTECSLMADYLNISAQQLGAQVNDVTWVALSMNPADSPDSVQQFLQSHHMTLKLRYLLGTHDQLAPLWDAFHMRSITQSDGVVVHSTGVYLLDQQGRERAFLLPNFNPATLNADVRYLLSHPA